MVEDIEYIKTKMQDIVLNLRIKEREQVISLIVNNKKDKKQLAYN